MPKSAVRIVTFITAARGVADVQGWASNADAGIG